VAASAVPAGADAAVGNPLQPVEPRDDRRVTLKDTDHIRTYYAMARN